MAIPVIPFRAEDLSCAYRTEITKEHIDLMSHVNVAHYTGFLARGFWNYFEEQMPGGTADVSKHGVFMIEQHIRYLNECHLGDVVAAYPRVVGVSKRCLEVVCYLQNETRDKLSAHSEMLLMGIDMERRRAERFPESVRQRLESAAAAHNALAWPPSVTGIMKPF